MEQISRCHQQPDRPAFNYGSVQMFWPSGEGIGKRVSVGAFVTDLVLCQNYFETIFTRLPKKIVDDVVAYLKEQELPYEPLGNGGQGGPDRRGGDDGRARPASVKARAIVLLDATRTVLARGPCGLCIDA